MVNSTASSELQVELLSRLSRNLSRCCEKGLSAPGVGFSNFETNYLVFSNTSKTKRLNCVGEVLGTISDSVRLGTSLVYCRAFGKVGFDGGGGARD